MKALLAGLALLLGATQVHAAGGGGKWYIGAGGGQTNYRDVCGAASSAGISGTCDDESNGWKIFGGYDLTNYFGIELAYADPGEAKLVASSPSAGTLTINSKLATAWAKLELPLGAHFTLLGKAGLNYFKADYERTGSFSSLNSGDDGLEPSIGAGASFKFTKNFALRAEWEQFNDAAGYGDGNIETLTASIVFRF